MKGLVQRAQPLVEERLGHRGHSRAREPAREPHPRVRAVVAHLAEVEQGAVLERAQLEREPLVGDLLVEDDVLEPADHVAEDGADARFVVQRQPLEDRARHQRACALALADREPDPPAGGLEPVVEEDQGPLLALAVGIGEDVLVDVPFRGDEVVEVEALHVGEEPALP
jgi:hypothetical protein